MGMNVPDWDPSYNCSVFPPAEYQLFGVLSVDSGPPPQNHSVQTFMLMPDGVWHTSVKSVEREKTNIKMNYWKKWREVRKWPFIVAIVYFPLLIALPFTVLR